MSELIEKILKEYHINKVESIKHIVNYEHRDNMWYINDKYFLKKFTDLNVLEQMLLANIELCQAGVPVATHYKTSEDKLYVEFNNEYYALSDKVAGSHSEYDIYTDNFTAAAFSLGQNIAKLHRALEQVGNKRPYAKIDVYSMENPLNNQWSWIFDEILKKKLEIKKEIIDYCISFDKLYHSLPKQLIHGDLHSGNILFKNGEVTAFLDYEYPRVDVKLFDICYYMRMEIDGKDKTDKTVEKWIGTLKNLLIGYNTISEFKKEELDVLPYTFILGRLSNIRVFSHTELQNNVIGNIESLNWFYENKSKFSFCKQDITQG